MSMLFKRIKDWATSITTFRTGDVIPVDGPLGSAKMSKDTLLELTAQNALAGNVAPAFVPNDTNAVAGMPYVYGGKLYVAKEVYQGPWDASKFTSVDISGMDLINVTNVMTASDPYNDFDSFPLNKVLLVNDVSNVANAPSTYGCIVQTIAFNSSSIIQHVSDSVGNYFVRSKYANTWSDWSNLAAALINLGSKTVAGIFADLNTYPLNRSVLIMSPTDVANKPVNSPYIVTTLGATDGALMQLLSTDQRKIYVRAKWAASWSDWMRVDGSLSAMGGVPSTNAPYNDLNTYPDNRMYLVITGYSGVANKPCDESFNIVTFGSSDGAIVQIFSASSGKIFLRNKWANNWYPWKRVDIEDSVVSPLCAFNEFIAIGDSITYGIVDTSATTYKQVSKPWPALVSSVTGVPQTTFAHGGYTAADAWNAYKDSFEAKTNALAIVFLGTNGGLTDTLDEDAPAGQPYSTWADTNTGCYAKIIAKLQDLGYKIVLAKPYIVGAGIDFSETLSVINQCGARFGACVIGDLRNDDLKYHYFPDLSGSGATHFNGLGYCQLASLILSRIAAAPTDQMKWIIPS